MKILALDTSGQTVSAAIVEDYITIGEFSVLSRSCQHSEILVPMLDRLFAFTGLAEADMDYVACVSGPGSFTGLRVGAATALALANGLGKQLIGVPTLDALAYNAGYGAAPGTLVVPMMDARRSQVYTAFYRCNGTAFPERLIDYEAAPVTEILGQLTATADIQRSTGVIFLGDGADAYKDTLQSAAFLPVFAPGNVNRQRASSVGACAMRQACGGPLTDFSLLYIRKSQAERALAERTKDSPAAGASEGL